MKQTTSIVEGDIYFVAYLQFELLTDCRRWFTDCDMAEHTSALSYVGFQPFQIFFLPLQLCACLISLTECNSQDKSQARWDSPQIF